MYKKKKDFEGVKVNIQMLTLLCKLYHSGSQRKSHQNGLKHEENARER